MHDTGTMRVIERLEDAVDVAHRVGHRHGAGGDDVLEQGALDELHDDVGRLVGADLTRRRVAGVEDADDRRMRHARGRLRLEPESVAEGGVTRQFGVEDLDRDLAPERQVVPAVHLRHSAMPDELVDAVPARDDSWLCGHG